MYQQVIRYVQPEKKPISPSVTAMLFASGTVVTHLPRKDLARSTGGKFVPVVNEALTQHDRTPGKSDQR